MTFQVRYEPTFSKKKKKLNGIDFVLEIIDIEKSWKKISIIQQFPKKTMTLFGTADFVSIDIDIDSGNVGKRRCWHRWNATKSHDF